MSDVRTTAEKIIAPLLILAATSTGSTSEWPLFGFGVSPEHLLLLTYLLVLLCRPISVSRTYYLILGLLTAVLALFSAVFVEPSSLHLLSFSLLALMFPLFINFFQQVKSPTKYMAATVCLLSVQSIFFSNREGGWDYLVTGEGQTVYRLAIHDFVSNSLGLMMMPLGIYFCDRVIHKSGSPILNASFLATATILLVLAFSRTALILYTISVVAMLARKSALAVLVAGVLFAVFAWLYSDIAAIGLAKERLLTLYDATRIKLWISAVRDFKMESIFFGVGLQNPPLDNTYLSIVLGLGLSGATLLVVAALITTRSVLGLKREHSQEGWRLTLLILIILIASAGTYDIFSQRKIIFGTAIALGAILANTRHIHIRR